MLFATRGALLEQSWWGPSYRRNPIRQKPAGTCRCMIRHPVLGCYHRKNTIRNFVSGQRGCKVLPNHKQKSRLSRPSRWARKQQSDAMICHDSSWLREANLKSRRLLLLTWNHGEQKDSEAKLLGKKWFIVDELEMNVVRASKEVGQIRIFIETINRMTAWMQ